jgi:hypothetical protein
MAVKQTPAVTLAQVDLCCEQTTEADCQDEQHDIAHITVRRTYMNDVGSSQFPKTRQVTPHGSNSGYIHPLCLYGDKGSNSG